MNSCLLMKFDFYPSLVLELAAIDGYMCLACDYNFMAYELVIFGMKIGFLEDRC